MVNKSYRRRSRTIAAAGDEIVVTAESGQPPGGVVCNRVMVKLKMPF